MLGLLFITNHHYYKWYVVILFLETFRNSLLCIHLVLNFKKDKRSILIEMSSLKTKLIFCPLAIDLYYDVFNMRVIWDTADCWLCPYIASVHVLNVFFPKLFCRKGENKQITSKVFSCVIYIYIVTLC